MTYIDPLKDLRRDLASVQNPIRYLGGEYGSVRKDGADLTFALAFPDLYEIGMSNLAIKVLYDGLNAIPSVRCERVFAPAPDFEDLLARKGVPLYTLESGIPLGEADVIGVSIGYEPGVTGLLSILKASGVPLEAASRGERDPIVLAGGCGVTNPAPLSRFVDAVFIGEAEAGLFRLVERLASLRKKGAGRAVLLAEIEGDPAVWTVRKDAGRNGGAACARRAVWDGFGSADYREPCFPVPSLRVVQDHGIVEIMRGCPNGCRFCHAGVYYRPQRMKDLGRIFADVDRLVNDAGYREISLMSLSSGDYDGIETVMDSLTARYGPRRVSFQLPSLKVNTFTLPLLERMAEVRKSGLTFAIETPVDAWQLSLNKEVHRDRIIEIMNEARRHGWSKAKFYFMVGLPVERGGSREEEEIVSFLTEIQERTRMQCTVNVGAFIPKPHTPYQWSRQLSMEEADRKFAYIHGSLPRGRFKVNTSKPFSAFQEGMLSRGDSRVADIVLDAFNAGARLDAWDDWARPEVWKAAIARAPWDVEAETIRARDLDESLPWDGVSLGVGKAFLRREMERSDAQTLSARCEETCPEPCGVCGSKASVAKVPESTTRELSQSPRPAEIPAVARSNESAWRVVVSFAKRGEGAFIPHLSLLEVWHKAFQRSGLPVVFTEGFNPVPRFEIAQSLSLGVYSEEEIASFMLTEEVGPEEVLARLAAALPRGIAVNRAFTHPLSGKTKRDPLSKVLWGSEYRYGFFDASEFALVMNDGRYREFVDEKGKEGLAVRIEATSDSSGRDDIPGALRVTVPFSLDRPFRDLIAEITGKQTHATVEIRKISTLAAGKDGKPTDFFDRFAEIADVHRKLLEA